MQHYLQKIKSENRDTKHHPRDGGAQLGGPVVHPHPVKEEAFRVGERSLQIRLTRMPSVFGLQEPVAGGEEAELTNHRGAGCQVRGEEGGGL